MTKPKRIMRKFRIDELSGVDVPAQEGALVTIMKRDDSEADIEKGGTLTTEEDGHQHMLQGTSWDGQQQDFGMTTWARAEGEDHDHAHAWARDEYTQEIDIAATEGHTHSIQSEDDEAESTEKTTFSADQRKQLADSGAALPDGSFPIRNSEDLHHALRAQGRSTKPSSTVREHIARRAKALGLEGELPESFGKNHDSNNGEDMSDQVKELESKVATLEKNLSEAQAWGALTDAEKAHYNSLDAGDRTSFMKMSRADRGAQITKAAEANPVVFTSESGETFRKNDDPRLVAMAKRNDELAKKAKEAGEREESATFAKRAQDELGHLPGEAAAKVALLKAVSSIADEPTRKGIAQILKAANTSLSAAFRTVGTSAPTSPTEGGRPAERLENLAKRFAEDNKVTIEKARVAVLSTPEGEAIYRETTVRGAGV